MRRVMQDGPGTVTFWWKVSSEANYDWLSFYADGVLQDRISGEVDWQQKSYPLGGDGTHALVWVYSKDSNDTDGSDRGWVDYLQWTPGAGGSSDQWEQITYTYDPSGRRIAKDVDGVVTRYVYDGDQCIAEYDANDVLLRKYVYGPGIDQPICMIEVADANAAYFYHYDALGSVVALSDAAGDTVQVYEYDVYGQVAASDPNHPNPFMFTGREFDRETGLYYYRARYYNASIGRFLQTDPIGYGDGMNAYTYCGNNGPNLSDPSGAVSGCGLRLREEGPYNDKGEPYAKFLEFYCIQDNGKPFEKLFRDIDEFMDWADSGGDGLFTDKWMQGEVGWELSGCHMTDKSDNDKWQLWRRWWFWRLKTLTWLDSSMNGVISRIESAEGHRIQLKFSHRNYYTGLDNTLEWNREADIISASNPWEWNHIHPLVGLAHELQHLHDDVYAGVYDKWSDAAREQSAMLGENSLRYALFQKDPTKCWLYPRPGYQDSYPDLGDTAKEAWENYNGRVGYGYTE